MRNWNPSISHFLSRPSCFQPTYEELKRLLHHKPGRGHLAVSAYLWGRKHSSSLIPVFACRFRLPMRNWNAITSCARSTSQAPCFQPTYEGETQPAVFVSCQPPFSALPMRIETDKSSSHRIDKGSVFSLPMRNWNRFANTLLQLIKGFQPTYELKLTLRQ